MTTSATVISRRRRVAWILIRDCRCGTPRVGRDGGARTRPAPRARLLADHGCRVRGIQQGIVARPREHHTEGG